MKIDKLVSAYVNLRNHRSDLEKKRKDLKKDMDTIEEEILKECDKQGVESFKTSHGTAYKKKRDFIKVENWDTALDYILANDLKHMLTKSVQKVAAKEFMEENKDQLPPGLEYGAVTEIGIRQK